jgi:hypothetical protein
MLFNKKRSVPFSGIGSFLRVYKEGSHRVRSPESGILYAKGIFMGYIIRDIVKIPEMIEKGA